MLQAAAQTPRPQPIPPPAQLPACRARAGLAPGSQLALFLSSRRSGRPCCCCQAALEGQDGAGREHRRRVRHEPLHDSFNRGVSSAQLSSAQLAGWPASLAQQADVHVQAGRWVGHPRCCGRCAGGAHRRSFVLMRPHASCCDPSSPQVRGVRAERALHAPQRLQRPSLAAHRRKRWVRAGGRGPSMLRRLSSEESAAAALGVRQRRVSLNQHLHPPCCQPTNLVLQPWSCAT